MGWLRISAATRQRTAPEFVLFAADGRRFARSDARDKTSLVLFFLDLERCGAGAAALQQVGRQVSAWAETEARALIIIPSTAAMYTAGDVPVVVDADGTVQAGYAALAGAQDGCCFVIVLDRYGAPYVAYAGDAAVDDGFGERLHDELTALYYDCPE